MQIRIRKFFTGIGALLVVSNLCQAEPHIPVDSAEADELVSMWNIQYPEAEELISQVLATMPTARIQLEGELRSKSRGGDYQPVAAVRMVLNATGDSGSASYAVSDFFGAQQETLDVRRLTGAVTHEYRAGTNLELQKFPGLGEKIRDTELTWADLTLSFLWWKGGKTLGRDKARGRSCYVIELQAPQDITGPVRSVKLWIDPKIGMLLRADSFAANGELIRSLSVKKFRKIDNIWMVSDIGVLAYPDKAGASLLIHTVTPLTKEPAGMEPAVLSTN